MFDLPTAAMKRETASGTYRRQFRNPVCVAWEWQSRLENRKTASALAKELKISRARVSQMLRLLKLKPDVLEVIASPGDPLRSSVITEHNLREILDLAPEEQRRRVAELLAVQG